MGFSDCQSWALSSTAGSCVLLRKEVGSCSNKELLQLSQVSSILLWVASLHIKAPLALSQLSLLHTVARQTLSGIGESVVMVLVEAEDWQGPASLSEQ